MKWAALAAGALCAAVFFLWAAGRLWWSRTTQEWRARFAPQPERRPQREAALETLPLPVQRYLRRALMLKNVKAEKVWLRQEGQFNLSEEGERWGPFSAEQLTSLGEPGFDWDARVRMAPGVTVFVRDAYAAGEGLTEARVFGLWPVAQIRGGGAIAEGQLLRFLAEAPWYPMILLRGELVEWSGVNDRTARAVLRHGRLQVSMAFAFGEDDSVMAVRAEARGRMSRGRLVPAPWQGRFWNYAYRNGIWMPLEGEVSWILPSGPHPYWRGRITEIRFDGRQ
jgi:hypothetical protein